MINEEENKQDESQCIEEANRNPPDCIDDGTGAGEFDFWDPDELY